MALHVIKKGLDLPITGGPSQELEQGKPVRRVALVAADYVGMKPGFRVAVGDTVQRGQVLFEDKKTPGVLHTSPGSGTVAAIHRGARRALVSVVIELNEGERHAGTSVDDAVRFESHQAGKDPSLYDRAGVQALLIESGLWTALRTRPFSKVPKPGSVPHAIFVTAMDSQPHAPPMDLIGRDREVDIAAAVQVLGKLTDGRVYFCKAQGSTLHPPTHERVQVEEFAGPHPSGLAGLHIHLLEPVGRNKTVWTVGLQDLLAMGHLFRTGELDVRRIISMAGPSIQRPRLLRTRLGASLDELTEGELAEGEQRVISGSVMSGRSAQGERRGYLGRFHNQVSALREGREREFIGWLLPGLNRFSVVRAYLSSLIPDRLYEFTTNTMGSERAMVPIGTYEQVMPFDMQPTFLLRSIIVNDVERAEMYGCLELDEEDVALCTFVCPGKYEYGPILRRNLTIIEKEG